MKPGLVSNGLVTHKYGFRARRIASGSTKGGGFDDLMVWIPRDFASGLSVY